MRRNLALIALLLAGCGGGGGSTNPPPIPTGQFTALYSQGIARCDDFNFGELHYCVKQQGAALGQIISMRFTISGTGTLYPVEKSDLPPATLRLFIAADPSGYSGTRWWCPSSKTNLSNGSFTVSCTISSEWTSVGGGLPDPGPPNGVRYVGFTMGGQYFAGHGVAANGPVHFHLDSYDISNTLRRKFRKGGKHG
jgi:hypothetical protein